MKRIILKMIAIAVIAIVIVACSATKPNNSLLVKDINGNKHFYELKVRDGRYYCYVHQQYEEVKIK